MGARAVTPLLSVGDFGTSTGREHVAAFDHDTATELVMGGICVVVPDDDVAREVLEDLGLTEEAVNERLQFSHSGRVGEPL